MPIHLGKIGSSAITVDVPKLIDTRLLVQANSGGGKSWLMRLLAEETARHVQTIILDPEGEYATLREAVDMVLVGSDGEIRAEVKTAKVLARRLLELNLSAVVDLYDLKLAERRQYLKAFLESLMAAPRSLWHPVLVIIDEAHVFCPERSAGQAESTEAVISLMCQGRKRGFCGILCTQRLSKLHKDAAAECNNVFIGKTTLDVDQQRAGDALGMSKAARQALRDLSPGEFYAFGPALSFTGVEQFKSAKVRTSHPETGKRHTLSAPGPSDAIKRILPELEKLMESGKSEIMDMPAAMRRIRELEKQVKKLEMDTEKTSMPDPSQIQQTVQRAVDEANEVFSKREEQLLNRLRTLKYKFVEIAKSSSEAADECGDLVSTPSPIPLAFPVLSAQRVPRSLRSTPALAGGGKLRILTALAQLDDWTSRKKLAIIAQLSPSSGTFSTYLGALKSEGLIESQNGEFRLTRAGGATVSDVDPLPTGDALIRYWADFLGSGGKRAIFEVLAGIYPNSMTRDALATAAGLSPSSGTYSTYLGSLRTLGLIEGSGAIRAAQELFE